MKQIRILIVCFEFILLIKCDSRPSFGKYFLIPTELVKCNYSKPIDNQHALDFNIIIIGTGKKKGDVSGYLHITSDFKYEKGSLNFDLWKNGKFESFLQRNTSSVCTDMLLSFPLRLIIKPDRNCIARTGNYTFSMNLNQFAHMLIGKNFFYQKIHARLEYFSKIGSVFCLEVLAETQQI